MDGDSTDGLSFADNRYLGSSMSYRVTVNAMKVAARRPRSHTEVGQPPDPLAELQSAWIAILHALPDRKAELVALYEGNAARFSVRALDRLLDIPRKGLLANALRRAGYRESASGPLPELGALRRDHYASSEVWTTRGAVAAWHVARYRGLTTITARELGERLLSWRDEIRA